MADPDIARRTVSPTSSFRNNKSFTHLARFIGFLTTYPDTDVDADDQLPTDSGSDAGDEPDDDNASPVDEESLMWDAQTALIAHQPALAAKYYATAALPPYSSPAACLALGNLLARGSGLAQPEDSLQGNSAKPKTGSDTPTRSWLVSFFLAAPAPVPVSTPALEESPKEEFPGLRATRLSSSGWELPKDGKRVVRNVEAMGKAAGWLVLGIGLILETEANRVVKPWEHPRTGSVDDGAVVFNSKGKGRALSHDNFTAATNVPAARAINDAPYEECDLTTAVKHVKLLYDLLNPLVQMYRHGRIQRHDPVALPPISHSQLPRALNPKGDKERGRNAWHLGSAVSSKLLDLPLLTSTVNLGKEANARRQGVLIMANYIRGLTCSLQVAEVCCKDVIRLGPCGLDLPDDLIRQAFRRLKSILKTTGGSPLSSSDADSFPFPPTPGEPRRRESNASWVSAADSNMMASLRLMSPVKSSASLASLALDNPVGEGAPTAFDQGAVTSLRDIQQSQRRAQSYREAASTPKQQWWPTLEGWSMATTPRQTVQRTPSDEPQHASRPSGSQSISKAEIKKPQLRIIASSPQLRTGTPVSPIARRRLPFEPKETIAPIDPELAALELGSALTKHVQCGVCGADGVNFPNCRKCGLTFCSRPCRINETGAGNGKRHVCGAWESRKLLEPPGRATYVAQPRVPVSTS